MIKTFYLLHGESYSTVLLRKSHQFQLKATNKLYLPIMWFYCLKQGYQLYSLYSRMREVSQSGLLFVLPTVFWIISHFESLWRFFIVKLPSVSSCIKRHIYYIANIKSSSSYNWKSVIFVLVLNQKTILVGLNHLASKDICYIAYKFLIKHQNYQLVQHIVG